MANSQAVVAVAADAPHPAATGKSFFGSFGFFAIVAGVVCVAAIFLYFRKRRKMDNGDVLDISKLLKLFPEQKQVAEITSRAIIAYFKDPEKKALLEEDKANMAVAVLKRQGDKMMVALCIFNQESSKVVACQILESAKMDESSRNMFGDKDMIVLQ